MGLYGWGSRKYDSYGSTLPLIILSGRFEYTKAESTAQIVMSVLFEVDNVVRSGESDK